MLSDGNNDKDINDKPIFDQVYLKKPTSLYPETFDWNYTIRRYIQVNSESNILMTESILQASTSKSTFDNYPKMPTSEILGIKEWTYTMRRSMQEIVPGLYLGPYGAAIRSQLEKLLKHGITHIVCVRQDIEANLIRPNFPDKFKYLVLNIADKKTENIVQHFHNVKMFIDEGLNSGGKVLVHGNSGISRSATLILAYMMETYGLSQTEAYIIVQQRRLCINPNEGFMVQLREYESIYPMQDTLKNDQQSTINQQNKQTIQDNEDS